MYAMLLAQNADEKAVLSLVLQRSGLAVTTGVALERAMQSWLERPADLILLALEGDPLEQVRRVRAETEVPLLVITDPIDERLHCELLETGADLVVPRPYGVRLLIAQVKALLRRAGGVPFTGLPRLSGAGLTLNPADRTVQAPDLPSRRLTHLEFRLLYTLMIHSGQTLPTDLIVERVWGYSDEGDKDLVRGLVSRLRAKIEPDPRNPRFVVTVPGVGYVFNPESQ